MLETPIHAEIVAGQIVLVGADGTRLASLDGPQTAALVRRLLLALADVDEAGFRELMIEITDALMRHGAAIAAMARHDGPAH
jgi:hypothetical protein